MGGSAREIVLDIVSEFGFRNDSGGIYKLGWDGKTNIEDNYGSQWVCRTQKWLVTCFPIKPTNKLA